MRALPPAPRSATRYAAGLALGLTALACGRGDAPPRDARAEGLDRDLDLARAAVGATAARPVRTRFVSPLEAGTASTGAARAPGHLATHSPVRRATRRAPVRVAAAPARATPTRPTATAVTLPAPAEPIIEEVASAPESVTSGRVAGDDGGAEHGPAAGVYEGDGAPVDEPSDGAVIRGGRVGDDDKCERHGRGRPIGTPPWGDDTPATAAVGRIIPVLAGAISRRGGSDERERAGGGMGGRRGGGPFRF